MTTADLPSTDSFPVIPVTTPPPWRGTSIMVHHQPDGTVAATTRGLIAVAQTEWAALKELARLVRDARRRGRL